MTMGPEEKVRPLRLFFADSEAEQDLNGLTGKPGFAMVLLAILQDSSFELKNRISAATYFKNYIRRHWDSTVQILEFSFDDTRPLYQQMRRKRSKRLCLILC
jgi:hypothetical protein